MTTATAQTITIDRDELRDILVDVSALVEYVHDLFSADDSLVDPVGPEKRLVDINRRLETLLGLASPEDGSEPSVEVQEEDDAVFQQASERGAVWLSEDRDEIFAMVGRKLGRCLRFFS
jgi:hypothetical protein